MRADGTRVVKLDPRKRVLFLTKDLAAIQKQLDGELDLRMDEVNPSELLDAYAGLMDAKGKRVFGTRALLDGGFQVIVSGQRKGTGSSRETAPQAEKWCGVELVIAASFAPIHERNNINLGQLMAGYEVLVRLQHGEEIPLSEFTAKYD